MNKCEIEINYIIDCLPDLLATSVSVGSKGYLRGKLIGLVNTAKNENPYSDIALKRELVEALKSYVAFGKAMGINQKTENHIRGLIIRAEKTLAEGEKYPCKPDIFEATYEMTEGEGKE